MSGDAGDVGSLGAAIISSCELCTTGAGTSLVLRSYECALTTEPALTTVFLFVLFVCFLF